MIQHLFKSELLNILKSRWCLLFTFLLAGISFAFLKISGDFHKTVLALSQLSTTLIPLATSFYVGLYWYYNDRYLELLLTQPIPRSSIYLARFLALGSILSLCSFAGPILPLILFGNFSSELWILAFSNVAISWIFTATTLFFVITFWDRIKGMGLILLFWIYLVLIHDGFLLLILIGLKDYPLEQFSGWLGALNPLGLARVWLMLAFDSALLLGHIGATTRQVLSSAWSAVIGCSILALWLSVPFYLGLRKMSRRDF